MNEQQISEGPASLTDSAPCNRTDQRDYDRHLYQDRNLVACFFTRLKPLRRMATRSDNLARNFVCLHLLGLIVNRPCCRIAWVSRLNICLPSP